MSGLKIPLGSLLLNIQMKTNLYLYYRKEEAEKKAKEAEEKKKRMEEAESKRQAMLEAQKGCNISFIIHATLLLKAKVFRFVPLIF